MLIVLSFFMYIYNRASLFSRGCLLLCIWKVDIQWSRIRLIGVDIAAHLERHVHKKRPKRGMNRHFKQKLQYVRTYTLLKLLHRSQPNFALFVRGPDMRIANPKWWTSHVCHSKNR